MKSLSLTLPFICILLAKVGSRNVENPEYPVSEVDGSLGAISSCGTASNGILNSQINRIYTFTIKTSSPLGQIPSYNVQFDPARKLAISVSAYHDPLNQIKNTERKDNFRVLGCTQLMGKEMECKNTFKMTGSQASYTGYTSWDRGHLVPVSPNQFEFEAMDNTFFCVNIAPQEPYTNQVPWKAIEDRSLTYFNTIPGFVITGTCFNSGPDGSTLDGYETPACFWKLICYQEGGSGAHQVVGFFGNNTLIPNASNNPEEKARRSADVSKPRSQAEILALIGGSAETWVERAWAQAGSTLTSGRGSSPPSASTCAWRKSLPDEVASEWGKIMRFDLEDLKLDVKLGNE